MISYINKGTEKEYQARWIDMQGVPEVDGVEDRCTLEFIQNALEDVPGVKVVSVEINKSGIYHAKELSNRSEDFSPAFVYTDIPAYADIEIDHETPGDHTERILVWIPLAWNGRFLGIGGGGSHVGNFIGGMAGMDYIRTCDPSIAVRNGFACAMSDAGYDFEDNNWALAEEGGELDWQLIYNWQYRSSHNMAYIGKKVAEAVYGRRVEYSYFMGTSGGGRQALMHAVHYPEDFDGVWSDAPGVYWNETLMSEFWPLVVMNEFNNYLSVEKLNAFRSAVWEEYGGKEAYFSFDAIERPDYKAENAIGRETSEGPLTELDAKVMQLIWDGPTDADGTKLHYGFRPGCESWCEKLSVGTINYVRDDPDAKPMPFFLSMAHVAGFVLRHKDFDAWDYSEISIDEYIKLFKESSIDLAQMDSSDPHLEDYAAKGGKLILTHGTDDDVLYFDATMKYYKNVCEVCGGKDEVEKFLRFYPFPGDGHSSSSKNGYGLSIATTMTALMQWVEQGIVPAELPGYMYDAVKNEIIGLKTVPFVSVDPEICK